MVLRRYAAGDRRFGEFLIADAASAPERVQHDIRRIRGLQADRLMASIVDEYRAEQQRIRRSPAQRLAEQVQLLLAGDCRISHEDFEYDFSAWHIALIVRGTDPVTTTRALATELDRQTLLVPRDDELVWAWLGGRRKPEIQDLVHLLRSNRFEAISAAIGEPRTGIDGWRLSHGEAQAGFQVMRQTRKRLVRGSEVALLVGVLRDKTLADSLRETYLRPLQFQNGSAGELGETILAYFATNGNAVAAGAALQVNRQTVQRRIDKVEKALGRLLHTCQPELVVALKLERLDLGGSSHWQ